MCDSAAFSPKFDMHFAARCGNQGKVEEILGGGFDINTSLDYYDHTALHEACHNGRFKLVEFLLAEGADPNIPDKNGNLPLHTAAGVGCLKSVKLLFPRTKNVNARDCLGRTALHLAAFERLTYVVEFLQQSPGVDKTIRDITGKTYLDILRGRRRW